MPRIGWNPARGQASQYRPPRVTAAVLTYLPEETGYFEHRFNVTRLCLESLIANTPQPFDLLVFDNGSCPRLVEYLSELNAAGRINYLILSDRNIGKIGALKLIARFAPGELIAYSDDDVLFLPGWLEEHLRILDTYPNVGAVTGFYMRPLMAHAVASTLAFADRPDVQVERGKLIPREMEQHFIDNMDRTWESYQEQSRGLDDLRLTYQGVSAFAAAGHHQFVTPREVLLRALPEAWEGQLMGKIRDVDAAIDRLGCLRLCTAGFPTRLLGNVVSPEMAALAREHGLAAEAPVVRSTGRLAARILRLKPFQWLAYKTYTAMFKIINLKD